VSDPIFVLFALCLVVALSEWLGSIGVGRTIGGALISIVLAMLLANLGLIPTASNAPPLYGQLVAVGAPVAIFLLLLDVNLSTLRRAGAAMLGAFSIGALGTMVGVTVAYHLTGASHWLGAMAAPLGGMYVATYIGGSANFNALALHYGLANEPALFAGANAVDNVVTTVWISALLVLPRLLHRVLARRAADVTETVVELPVDSRPTTLGSIATLIALAIGGYWLSDTVAAWLAIRGVTIPSMLILTTIALLVAQLPTVQRLGGASLLGTYGAYLFLAVIGSYCALESLVELGRIGAMLFLFVALAVGIHGIVAFGAGRLFRLSPEMIAVASSANIGGATTVMPIARGLARMDLLLPGVLAGSLGTAIGTYAGFLMAWLLGR